MSCAHSMEELEALARGELSGGAAERVAARAAGCPSCRDELAWLRREVELMAGRAARQEAAPPSVWARVERRIELDRPRVDERHRRGRAWMVVTGAGMGAALLAAVAGSIVHHFDRRHSRVQVAVDVSDDDDDADQELAAAEEQYREAAAQLEAVYAKRRARLGGAAPRIDKTLLETKAELVRAERDAKDVESRQRLLDGYAEYVHSLETVVYEVDR